MSVGNQTNNSTIDSNLTNYSVALRDLMFDISNLFTSVTGAGNGLTYLAQVGYSTAPSASNPGGVSDAQLALNIISNFNTLAGVYYGSIQQGGTGGTGATTFNFNNSFAQLWNGR